jgi:hypothetical protein
VKNLITYASDCSGKEAISRHSTLIEAIRNTTGTPLEQGEKFLNLLVPPQWLQAIPDVTNYTPNLQVIRRLKMRWMGISSKCTYANGVAIQSCYIGLAGSGICYLNSPYL